MVMRHLKAIGLLICFVLVVYGLIMFGIHFPMVSIGIGIGIMVILGGYQIYQVFYDIANGRDL